ncbi:hypothetical protein [Methanococcoides methylutens]|uniref:hypothetical protein n=1 Tax=Methanococcoides methylutens TaxID=2226 RepID=UPI000694C70F|nr:hypothetical protein [Methanococcoides methylutens]
MLTKINSTHHVNVQYRIYLDMDNVITDFNYTCNSISSDLVKLHSFDRHEFWKVIGSQGISFWSEMPWKRDGKELVDYLLNYNTTILSAHPNPKRGSVVEFSKKGKYDWLAREIGKDFADKAIICRRSEKKMYSTPNCILVDDNAENIENWKDAGGIGILHFAAENTIGKLRSSN